MALTKCPECKKEMSSKAKSCPHCGFAKPEPTSFGCGSLILIAIVISIVVSVCSPDKKPSTPAVQTPKTPEQIREETIKGAFSGWDGSHSNLERYVKKNLKDPDSYEHIETRYGDRGDHIYVLMKYRAKNSFGGYVIETITATTEIDGTIITINPPN